MDFLFERKNGLNCVEYLIKAIAGYYETDYELMFIGSWGFDLNLNLNIGDKGFISPNNSKGWELLAKYHGLIPKHQTFNKFLEFENAARKYTTENNPVIAYVDLFWLPWAVNDFQKNHWDHAILITGVKKNSFLCYDFFSTHEMEVSFDMLKNCYSSITTFNKIHQPSDEYKLADYLNDIKWHIQNNIIRNNGCDRIAEFSKYLNNEFFLNINSTTLASFQTSNLMIALNRIAQCRYQYGIMLGYLGNKYDCNELSMLSKETDTIAISWKSIWGMLQKAYLVDNSNAIVKRVADKILQISQQETRLLADIVDYINNRTIICDFAYDAKVGRNRYKLTEKISRINLEKYLNHKAVGTLEDPQEARFEEGFILSDMWLENNSLQCDSVEYRLYTIGKTYDNIAALGQTIEINDTCTAIAFLSCAEFGHQNDSLIVNGADGKIELMFGVTDWTCSPPAFQESVAWKGHEGVIVGENCNKKHPLPRYIFSKIYKLPKRMHITNLLLPYCPNIHIFAITCIE